MVECNLAKVEVASSNLVSRSIYIKRFESISHRGSLLYDESDQLEPFFYFYQVCSFFSFVVISLLQG